MTRYSLLSLLIIPLMAVAQERPAPAVETAPVQMKQLAPRVTVTGQVQSRAAADLSASIAGRLAWVAEPGARVARNGLIARLDTDEIQLQKLEQQARLKRGEIQLDQLTREAARLRASGSAVSRVQLDNSESARDLAAADLEIARATLRQTEERLSRAEVRAPFGGVVSERLKRDGEEVNRGEAVVRLMDPDTLEIRLFLPLRHVRAIKAGDKVKVLFDGRESTARVRAIVPAGDARSQSFEVLVGEDPRCASTARGGSERPASNGRAGGGSGDYGCGEAFRALPAGGVVQVELPLGEPQALIAVPRDALIIRADGMTVYRVNSGEKGETRVERIVVKSGAADGDWVAVTGKLAARDAVVVRGGESLQDGATVKIVGTRTSWNTGSPSAPSRSSP